MRARAFVSAVVALPLVLAACGKAGTPSGSPQVSAPVSPSAAASPSELAGASCLPQEGGSSSNVPRFVDVVTERVGGVERISFRFEPGTTSSNEPPTYSARFVPQLVSDAEGAPVRVDGVAYLAIAFGANGVDLTANPPTPIYTGPQDIKPGFPVLLEARELGDFEATVTWGLGLSRPACFRIVATSHALTIELPTA